MFIFLSKVLTPFVLPLGLGLELLVVALILERRGRRRAAAVVLVLVIVGLGGLSTAACADYLVGHLESRHPVLAVAAVPAADAIVILGGGTSGRAATSPDVELSSSGNRLLHGYRLLRAGKAPLLILSGGGLYPGESEAEQMREILSDWGVTQDRLVLETRSRNTYENAVESTAIACARGMKRLVLVTSASHMWRAAALFERQGARCGLQILPAPTAALAPTALVYGITRYLPNVGALDTTTTALRERLGIAVYHYRGWL